MGRHEVAGGGDVEVNCEYIE